ncbi:hypothetical protein A3759_21055 [Thalassolituus sp. HI0120]|jgi:hypothetical protein|nr:hypothetical protein A3759_01975 [Thalassolituus sp. HI0120]KZZ44250.1 hypothetical protein A3759_21055 [Thalassolituus sp. HI0120]
MIATIMEILGLIQAQEKLMQHAYYDNLLQVQQQTRKRVQRNLATHNSTGKNTRVRTANKQSSAGLRITLN